VAARAPARPVRIVLAKVGLDGHDRGVKVVARALRDAGYEVIYTGLRQTPEMVVDAALQEDAQVIGLSLHSGAHMTLFPRVMDVLKQKQAVDIVVFGGGIIPQEDIDELKRLGVAEIFTPGTPLQEIVEWLRNRFKA
jgi:methylmalonyl-CoA mutase C-terminal domain/subunit